MDKKTVNLSNTFKGNTAPKSFTKNPIKGTKFTIAVSSAKGGVGKSTICAHLASQFSKDFKVGILDADIYGPNQHLLFDVSDCKPDVQTVDGSKIFIPIHVNNILLNSMGFVIDNDKDAMWRGPMLSGAIKQLKNLTGCLI